MFYIACPLEQKLDIQEMVDRRFLWKGCACGKEVTSPTQVQMVQGSILPPNKKKWRAQISLLLIFGWKFKENLKMNNLKWLFLQRFDQFNIVQMRKL